jgi:hypothetical protein
MPLRLVISLFVTTVFRLFKNGRVWTGQTDAIGLKRASSLY